MQSSNQLTTTTDDHQVPSSFSVCGRPTKVGTPKDLALLQNFNDRDGGGKNCPGANSNDVLIIQGLSTFGRTGNNLIEVSSAGKSSPHALVIAPMLSGRII